MRSALPFKFCFSPPEARLWRNRRGRSRPQPIRPIPTSPCRDLVDGRIFYGNQIYDPASGTLSNVSGNLFPFSGSSTRLADGRVLITEYPGVRAELYDPVAQTFTLTGNMTVVRQGAQAYCFRTAECCSWVAITQNPQAIPVDLTAEIYDPASDTFVTVYLARRRRFPARPRFCQTDVLGPYYSGDTAIYDPVQSTFTPLNFTLYSVAAILLATGKVLFVSGMDDLSCGGGVPGGPASAVRSPIQDVSSDRWKDAGRPDPGVPHPPGRWHGPARRRLDLSGKLYGRARIWSRQSRRDLRSGHRHFHRHGKHDERPNRLRRSLASGRYGSLGRGRTAFLPRATRARGGNLPSRKSNQSACVVYELDRTGRCLESVTGALVSPGGAFVPAHAGDILSTYTNNLIEGGALPPQVSVGGKAAKILYFGDAPGYSGYFQINFQVPPA